jgi:multiple sugar transport system permease protein
MGWSDALLGRREPPGRVSGWAFVERIEAGIGERGVLALFLAPALIVLLTAQFYPLAYSAWVSTVDWTLSRSPVPGGFVGLDNYTRAFSDTVFIDSIRITVAFALATTALQMVLGFALAYLTVGEGTTLRLSRTLLLMPMVIAPVAVGTIWRMMLSARVGPVNGFLAGLGIQGPDWLGDPDLALVSLILIDAWEWTPFVMVIYVAALTSLPAEPLRAAAVDGASRWQIFRFIVFPMLLPVTLLIAMFRLIDALLTLDVVFTTTFGGPGFATHTISFWIYQQGLRYFNISYAAATSWILLVACMAVAAGVLAWRARLARWQAAR